MLDWLSACLGPKPGASGPEAGPKLPGQFGTSFGSKRNTVGFGHNPAQNHSKTGPCSSNGLGCPTRSWVCYVGASSLKTPGQRGNLNLDLSMPSWIKHKTPWCWQLACRKLQYTVRSRYWSFTCSKYSS